MIMDGNSQKKGFKPLTVALAGFIVASLFGTIPTAYSVPDTNVMTSGSTTTTPATDPSTNTSGAMSTPSTTLTTPATTSSTTTTSANTAPAVQSAVTIQANAPLNQPNMSDDAIISWATDAARSTYSYDFKNYSKQMDDNKQYFTNPGWKAFSAALNNSNNLNVVQSKKLVASGTPTGKAIIIKKGLRNGVYTWEVQVPLLATYESESKLIKQNLVITMLINRNNSPSGVGISHFVAVVVPSSQSPITATGAPSTTSTTTTTTPPATIYNTTTTPSAGTTTSPYMGSTSTTTGITTGTTITTPSTSSGSTITNTNPSLTGTTNPAGSSTSTSGITPSSTTSTGTGITGTSTPGTATPGANTSSSSAGTGITGGAGGPSATGTGTSGSSSSSSSGQ